MLAGGSEAQINFFAETTAMGVCGATAKWREAGLRR
jgi:hypothetical protein